MDGRRIFGAIFGQQMKVDVHRRVFLAATGTGDAAADAGPAAVLNPPSLETYVGLS
ncbi:MAG: hypothetical protein ACK2U2_20155 [Anaerolineae bacterium]